MSSKDKVTNARAVVPSDTAVMTLTAGLYIGAAGNITVKYDIDGDPVTISDAANGYHPHEVVQVMATGTTAANILALY